MPLPCVAHRGPRLAPALLACTLPLALEAPVARAAEAEAAHRRPRQWFFADISVTRFGTGDTHSPIVARASQPRVLVGYAHAFQRPLRAVPIP